MGVQVICPGKPETEDNGCDRTQKQNWNHASSCVCVNKVQTVEEEEMRVAVPCPRETALQIIHTTTVHSTSFGKGGGGLPPGMWQLGVNSGGTSKDVCRCLLGSFQVYMSLSESPQMFNSVAMVEESVDIFPQRRWSPYLVSISRRNSAFWNPARN